MKNRELDRREERTDLILLEMLQSLEGIFAHLPLLSLLQDANGLSQRWIPRLLLALRSGDTFVVSVLDEALRRLKETPHEEGEKLGKQTSGSVWMWISFEQ